MVSPAAASSIGPGVATKARVGVPPCDRPGGVDARGMGARWHRGNRCWGAIEGNERAIRAVYKCMTAIVGIIIKSRHPSRIVDTCNRRAMPAATPSAWRVDRDDRWRVLSKSGRTNQRSTNKYPCKQLNDSSEHVHFDLSSVSLHVCTPFPVLCSFSTVAG